MWTAHAEMVATERDWDVVALEVAATLSFCGCPSRGAGSTWRSSTATAT
jgi:hypothetical protein